MTDFLHNKRNKGLHRACNCSWKSSRSAWLLPENKKHVMKYIERINYMNVNLPFTSGGTPLIKGWLGGWQLSHGRTFNVNEMGGTCSMYGDTCIQNFSRTTWREEVIWET